jgi:hypothetical protein
MQKKVLKMFQKNREFKILKAGVFSAAFVGFLLSASNVFADIVAPTTNTPYMGSGTSIGAGGQSGNQVAVYDNYGDCRGGGGDDGYTGSPSTLNIYQSILAPSGYGTGVYALSKGGTGGEGGRNTNSDCYGYGAKGGGKGGTAAPINVWLVPGAASGTTFSSTGIYAVSGGGNGGDGGRNNQGGNAGSGGMGGYGAEVYVSNTASIITGNTAGSYGIYAQSYGGNGGRGGNGSGFLSSGDGGGGGYGGPGGPVEVANSGSIQSNLAIPIFAQSLGGIGGGGGDSRSTFSGGSSGGGGNGASAGWISVSNSASLSSAMIGGFGIHAQSVGGSGGAAGASAGLVALGGDGGEAATGGSITLTNSGAITLTGTSSSGLHAQSVGGGGGHGDQVPPKHLRGGVCACAVLGMWGGAATCVGAWGANPALHPRISTNA